MQYLRAIYIIKNCANKSAVFSEQMTALLNESRTREPYTDFMVLRHCNRNTRDKLLLCYNLASTLQQLATLPSTFLTFVWVKSDQLCKSSWNYFVVKRNINVYITYYLRL